MKENIEKVLEDLRRTLSTEEDYENFNVEYIMIDPVDNSNSFAIAFDADEIIKINIETKEISDVAEWAYNVDDDIFGELEEGKEIGYMTANCHYGIWYFIETGYPYEIECTIGLQKYFEYCKANNITKETIEQETKSDDVYNIMRYYEDKSNKINIATRKLDNGINVIDIGYRNDQPVALVERTFVDGKEFIIAFDYQINDNKMDWGYGYYYAEDIEKAQNDFKKVLAGGNLADTFDKNKKERER